MKKLFVVMASADKGRSWTMCGVPFMQSMFMAEDQASAEAMLDKEYELFKKRKGKAKRSCFEIVEFSGVIK